MTKSEFMKRYINDYYKNRLNKKRKEQDAIGYVVNKNYKLHKLY